jgi:hypothetical protein
VAAVVRAQRVGVALRVPQRGRSRFLGRPASRSYSSTEQDPIIEEKACATGGPSHLLRVVLFDYLARVLRADAREGRYLSMPGTRVFRRAKACGVLGMGGAHIGRSAARSSCGLGRPESRRSGRSVESRRERSGRRRRQGVWENTAPDGSRLVSCGCGSQVALDPALLRLSAEPLRAGPSAPY